MAPRVRWPEQNKKSLKLAKSEGIMTEAVIAVFVVMACIWTIAYRLYQASQNAELRRTNPDLWMRKKELEEAEKQRQHERRQARMKAGGTIGMMLWKIFTKR
jgi:hypothetical protein